jgi:outer membrane protein W
MKKHVAILAVTFLLVILASSSLFAQRDPYQSGYDVGLTGFGVKGGLDVSKLIGSQAKTPSGSSLNYRTGAVGGIFATYNFSSMWAVQPELLYNIKGTKFSTMVNGVNYNFKTRVDYIDIPILAKAYFTSESQFHPNLFAGPDIAFRTRARVTETGPGISNTTNIKSSTKSTDFGFTGGIGADYALMNAGKITLDARYFIGVTKVDNSPAKLNQRNNNFSFLVGYSFR